MSKLYIIVLLSLSSSFAQQILECPPKWVAWQDRCYKFNAFDRQPYDAANVSCSAIGSKLLAINDEYEHTFVSQWLRHNDTQREPWYTSGRKDETVEGGELYYWDSENRMEIRSDFFWITNKHDGNVIVYAIDEDTPAKNWGWDLSDPLTNRPYICEIEKSKVSSLFTDERGKTFGAEDINDIKHGPHIVIEPETVIHMSSKAVDNPDQVVYERAEFDCQARANPDASYYWQKQTDVITEIKPELRDDKDNNHYTMTNGKLIIHNPDMSKDGGKYQCIATNKFGTVLSQQAQLVFGYLGKFSNSERSTIYTTLNYGTAIDCMAPDHFPPGEYMWFKDSTLNRVDPERKPHIFVSKNGHLYFSQARLDDTGTYYCMISIPLTGGRQDGRQNKGQRLEVSAGGSRDSRPEILSSFPNFFPTNPLRGSTITLECFAYGTGDLRYTWTRKSTPLPPQAILSDNNRKLTIPDAQFEDQGTYVCNVRQLNGADDVKETVLTLNSLPYFTQRLKDEFVDVDGEVELRCEAQGMPTVSYSWYKNGVKLEDTLDFDDKERITINSNVLRITKARADRDNGMYQCAAENTIGTEYSTSQIQVISFKPTFSKRPMEPVRYGTMRFNVTLGCHPEGAPNPEKQWFKNGRQLTLSNDPMNRLYRLPNGNLFINRLNQGDHGEYVCKAVNPVGDAVNSTQLIILESTGLLYGPYDTWQIVNRTLVLPCEASVSPMLDYTYIWEFNNYPLELDDPVTKMKNMNRGKGIYWGYLYINGIRFDQAGRYRCKIQTTEDVAWQEATVDVIGPPGRPAGVSDELVRDTSIVLRWTTGATHGRPITSYLVEGQQVEPNGLVKEDRWVVLKSNIILVELEEQRTRVMNLIPWSQYVFRMKAINALGIGDPSLPTRMVTTATRPPSLAPRKVGGGGGKVGLLRITWEPLARSEQNGPGIGYMVEWRVPSQSKISWSSFSQTGQYNEHYVLVMEDNYYKPYEVRITAFNDLGSGPASPPVIVHSAEGMPKATPTRVRGRPYNESCIEVKWEPVTSNREQMKGVLQGFRINYYQGDPEDEGTFRESALAKRQTILGNVDRGLIVGLLPDTYYWITVQVFNGAGNGPLSNPHPEHTWRKAPEMPPYRVEIHRGSDNSVLVQWMGIMTEQEEEPLQGYKIRYWTAGEGMEKATDKLVGIQNSGVISGLAKETRYYLRVLGYSLGGDGTMSSPLIQFEMGDYYFWSEGAAGAGAIKPILTVILICITTFLYTWSN